MGGLVVRRRGGGWSAWAEDPWERSGFAHPAGSWLVPVCGVRGICRRRAAGGPRLSRERSVLRLVPVIVGAGCRLVIRRRAEDRDFRSWIKIAVEARRAGLSRRWRDIGG